MVGQEAEHKHWLEMAEARRQAINEYLWNPEKGLFFDYDFTTGKQSDYVYATTFYPLWAGLATKEQAAAVDKNLALLDKPGGLASSTYASGLQWDLPFGWAPLNWFAFRGLWTNGYINDARRVAEQFTHTVRTSFEKEGTIHEKYNVETGSSNVEVIAGYQNVIGFGWTNAVYVEMEHLLGSTPSRKKTE
jgi:alpha,alpha-trehalase